MTEIHHRVLIVDDDSELAAMLEEFLQLHGFQVELHERGDTALDLIATNPPDLLVLDVMLPGMDGFAVLKALRKDHDLPVIMLTARGAESDRILGLMRGADDYLPKPFNPLELVARINAVLKRVGGDAESQRSVLNVGSLKLDLKRRELMAGAKLVAITAAEMRVIEQLMRSPGEVLTRAKLTERALDRKIEPFDRSIDTLISKLRRKITDAGIDGSCIRGLRGHGYVLDEQQTQAG